MTSVWRRRAAFVLVVAVCVSALSCALWRRKPPVQRDVPLVYEIRAERDSVGEDDPLWIVSTLRNSGTAVVTGCVGPYSGYQLEGTKRTENWTRFSPSPDCQDDGEFWLDPGEQFRWRDAVSVPDVGVGRVGVTGIAVIHPWGDGTGRPALAEIRSNRIEVEVRGGR